MEEGFKFLRVEMVHVGPGTKTEPVAVITFGDGEQRWNEESVKTRMDNAPGSANLSEEARALAEIRRARGTKV
jgi:hypothetical protein